MLLALLLACAPDAPDRTEPPAVSPGAPALRRLTEAQYVQTVTDLLGDGLALPTALEPDAEAEGLLSVGNAVAAVSTLGVERYEGAAWSLAEQVVADPERRARVLDCAPATPDDAACAEAFAAGFARVAWRRTLTAAEVDRLVAVVTGVGAAAGDFEAGLTAGLAVVLQSPHFLYRREHGVPDPEQPGVRRLTGPELATRLAYTLWNTTPDADLLDAAEAGELDTVEGLRDHAERLLADERARRGLRNLYTELLHLYELDDVDKDPTVYTHAAEELGPAAREETLRVVEHLLYDRDADLRTLFTTQTTFVDRRLAALYDIPAPSLDGFGEALLDPRGGRRGLLGHASLLMLEAHATRSSATLRGKFVRTVILCQAIPPPPGDVATTLPEPDADAPTLRERVETHLEEPSCAACHQVMDPVGLTLENFDGVGRWRDTENGAVIDASGELDGQALTDAWDLGGALAAHEDLGPCLTSHLYRYAVGRSLAEGEEPLRDWLAEGLPASGWSWATLVLELVTSDGFRSVGEIE